MTDSTLNHAFIGGWNIDIDQRDSITVTSIHRG
jgi:hypothetical protein